jgi:hypothetical protein
MNILTRILAALALAICLALPAIGGEGGGSGETSGGGVWVLPRSGCMFGLSSWSSMAPRDTHQFAISSDVVLQASTEVGIASAIFLDDLSGLPVSLNVSGTQVRIPTALMLGLAQSPGTGATIMIVDAQMQGYLMRLSINAGQATITVY